MGDTISTFTSETQDGNLIPIIKSQTRQQNSCLCCAVSEVLSIGSIEPPQVDDLIELIEVLIDGSLNGFGGKPEHLIALLGVYEHDCLVADHADPPLTRQFVKDALDEGEVVVQFFDSSEFNLVGHCRLIHGYRIENNNTEFSISDCRRKETLWSSDLRSIDLELSWTKSAIIQTPYTFKN